MKVVAAQNKNHQHTGQPEVETTRFEIELKFGRPGSHKLDDRLLEKQLVGRNTRTPQLSGPSL